ncbi:MAG: hypothetical protein RLZZ630_436 [Bacteroidota bacterium]|jgi:putative membrane protein
MNSQFITAGWRAFSVKHLFAISIFLLWLTHVSALIGISIGHLDWFIPKTPLNLLLAAFLLVINFPVKSLKSAIALMLFMGIGYGAEWIGVNTGLLFGNYAYGDNLGVKVGGVPLLIGLNWALLAFAALALFNHLNLPHWLKPLLGALLMVTLDFFMETSAPVFDFWSFANNIVPLWNYICWFMLSWLMLVIGQRLRIHGDYRFSLQFYLVNFTFFGWFHAFPPL